MEQAKILIVDDDQDIREAIQAMLLHRQYAAITAGGITEGMEKVRAEKPDLVILDVMMNTWTDGFDMARELKKDDELKDILILMLTGVKDQTGIDFKSTAGDPALCPVDGFLDKPVEPETLVAEVERLLSTKNGD